MLTFLRKVRKSLIETGSIRRYLLYATGEVLLVMVGILLALQINNWNEWRKDRLLEDQYYCRLLEDVEQDKIQLEEFLKKSMDRLKASNEAVRLLQQQKVLKEEIGIQMSLSIRGVFADFVPNNSAFEDLKSGANLNVIRDKNIIKALNKYYNRIREYSSVAKVNADISLDRFRLHKDRFATGWVHATMNTNRFIDGMEPEVYEAMKVDKTEHLSNEIQFHLYNDALINVSSNSRRIELFGFIMNEIEELLKLLLDRCPE